MKLGFLLISFMQLLPGNWATWQLGYLACMVTGLPGNWAAWLLGYLATGLHGNWAIWPAWLLGYMATQPAWQLGYLATGLHGNWATWQLGCMATGLHGYWATWQLGYLATGLHGNWATWQLGCMATGLPGHWATWLLGCQDTQNMTCQWCEFRPVTWCRCLAVSHNVKIFMLTIRPAVGKQKLSPCYILYIKTLKTLCRQSTNLPFVKLKQMRIGFRTEKWLLYVTQTKGCKVTTNWQQCIQPEPFCARTRVNSGKRQKFLKWRKS